jgi:spore maturation protein CgeB
MLKFIIPGQIYADSFAENVAFTLREMGYEVLTRPAIQPKQYHSRFRNYFRLVNQKLNPQGYLPPEEKWLLETARRERPNILLTLTQSVSELTLAELKRLGVTYRVAWWGDAPTNLKRLDLLSSEWDALFLKDREAVNRFRGLELKAYLLHEALNPAWHKPLAGQKNNQVVVAGNYYGHRQFLVRKLLGDGIELGLYGPNVPLWSFPEVKQHFNGRFIVKEEKSRVFGEGLACLNSTSFAEGNSLNCRAFEIAGAGGLQLLEHRPVIEECFEPGKEVLVYRTYQELLDQIERAKKYPAEMVAVREAGAKRALAEHTYRHRLTEILRTLDLARPEVVSTRPVSLPVAGN